MVQKLMICCKLVQVGTKEHGKMLKRIQILEGGRVPAKEAKNCRIEGERGGLLGKEYRKLLNELESGGSMAQKGPWNLAREKIVMWSGSTMR